MGWYEDLMGSNTPAPAPQITSTPWRSAQVDAPAQMAESTPISGNPSTGGITPSPDTSGLYAIYGRKNPAQASADRYSRMAGMDMGGRLGQLPGIVATFMAGKKQKEADAVDAQKEADIKTFMARKEAYDGIKNERDTRKSNADYLTNTVFPAAQQEYARILTETKDLSKASAGASQVANKMAADQGIPAPEVVAFNAWKGATTFAVINDSGEKSTAIYKDGAMMVQDKKGDFKPMTEKWLSLKDVSDQMRSNRPAGGANPAGMLEFYDANGNLVAKTKDQNEAIKAGAVTAGRWVKTIDELGNDSWKQEMVPLSKAQLPPKGQLQNTQVAGQPPAPARAQTVNTQFNRPVAVPGSPGSGQAPAPVAPPAPAPQAPAVDPKRAKAIAQLESSKNPLTEANIAYVMKQIP